MVICSLVEHYAWMAGNLFRRYHFPFMQSFFLTFSLEIMEQDSEYLLLNTINDLTRQKAGISQRDLSRAIQMSLGMTNVLLKRLSQKGFVLINKVSPRNVSYVLTPDGMNELAKRTKRYLKGTMQKVVSYKEAIVSIAEDARTRGFKGIGLLGKSDIDFIIEYAASHAGLSYSVYADDSTIPGDSFVFVSENFAGSCTIVETSASHVCALLSGGQHVY